MTRISAADNLVIDIQSNRWQLLINTNFVENVQGDGVLLEASDGQPLRYTSAFARTRHLPRSGALSANYVQRVVLGWSWDDEAWHLGLLLAPELAEARGSRWCQLAQWPDPEQDVYHDLATEAGQSLAKFLSCPFNLIPIKPEHQTEHVEQPVKPLPEIPLELQEWTLKRHGKQNWLVLQREKSWQRERQRRMVWYGFWSIIYVLLAVLVLFSDIARPRPEYLPYVAIGVALMLVGLVVYARHELRTKAQRIIIDPETRRIWGLVNGQKKPIWRYARQEIDTIYISEVLKVNKGALIQQYAELNLRMTDGGHYFFLFNQEEGQVLTEPDNESDEPIAAPEPTLAPFTQNEAMSNVHYAAFHIANALGVPVWIDRRNR